MDTMDTMDTSLGHIDPFAPVLYASSPLVITEEQENAVRTVLLLSSSDTRFAQKAADALRIILLGGINNGVVPVITSLEPATGVVGAVNLKIKAKGTGFDAGTVIYVDSVAVPTLFTSATEVSTTVTPTVAGTKQVLVKSAAGALSNIMTFTVTEV